ncbi:hypothetical protein [Actinomadura macra]|uniref:hypothetical protein n=1 Tax=Actinomadura macra TaxID=46164 RepID=UPI00083044AE|nr:hypothetical protein [Actinomadura macra]
MCSGERLAHAWHTGEAVALLIGLPAAALLGVADRTPGTRRRHPAVAGIALGLLPAVAVPPTGFRVPRTGDDPSADHLREAAWPPPIVGVAAPPLVSGAAATRRFSRPSVRPGARRGARSAGGSVLVALTAGPPGGLTSRLGRRGPGVGTAARAAGLVAAVVERLRPGPGTDHTRHRRSGT